MRRLLTVALLSTLAACGSTEPQAFRIDVAGPDAKVGTRRQSPDGYYNVLECSWSVTISARGGSDGDVAQIIGASLDAVGPGYRSTNNFNADETIYMLGTDHITTGQTLAPPPWDTGSDVPAASGSYLPFTATVTYRFQVPSGEVKEASHALACK